MSVSYRVGQYEQEFVPKRLGMYEVPKENLSKAPKPNGGGITDFVADSKGHLLPGARKGETNPFGDFVGTWDLPKSIPGPVQINPTGRSGRNLEKLSTKKEETEIAIKHAKDAQKPLALRKNVQAAGNRAHNDSSAFDKIISYSPNNYAGQDTDRSQEKDYSPRD